MHSSHGDLAYPGGSVKAEGLGDGLLCGEGFSPLRAGVKNRAKMALRHMGKMPMPRQLAGWALLTIDNIGTVETVCTAHPTHSGDQL